MPATVLLIYITIYELNKALFLHGNCLPVLLVIAFQGITATKLLIASRQNGNFATLN